MAQTRSQPFGRRGAAESPHAEVLARPAHPALAAAATVWSCALAAAQPAPQPPGSAGEPAPGGAPQQSQQPSTQDAPAGGNPSIQSTLGPLGDPGGLRAALAERGIAYGLTSITEALGDPFGGARRGAVGEGLLNIQADVDLGTLMGWIGGKLHANGYKIFGDGLTRGDLLNLSVASGIEALPSTRLYKAWFEQTFMDGKLSLRLGQLGADSEFIISQYATLFIDSTYGWPNFTAYDLPSGGPAYPLAAPEIRLKYAPDEH